MFKSSRNMAPKATSSGFSWADEMNGDESDENTPETPPEALDPSSDPEQPPPLTRFQELALSRAMATNTTPNIVQADQMNAGASGADAQRFPFSSDLSPSKPSPAPTVAEVRQLAHDLAKSIFSDFAQLKEVVENYEDKLRKRWESKTRGHKALILLEAWPNMAFSHRPDFEAFLQNNSGKYVQGKTQFKDAYMWPQINLEDLTYGRTLLLYIDSRGRHAPQTFVYADWASCFLGRRTNSIPPGPLLKSHTMFLDGRTAIRYGRLVAWDEDAEAHNQLISGSGFLTVKGLMILEIQQRIMNFLVKCCQIILSDLTTSFVHPAPTRPFTSAPKTKLNVIAAEAPYRIPTNSDFGRLEKVFLARRAAAEDHICALRTHPGYFANALVQRRQHRFELLLDESGGRHPHLDSPSFWDCIISELIQFSYADLFIWDLAWIQLRNVLHLNREYSEVISPKKKLPDEYMEAILTLRYTLKTAEEQLISELARQVPYSPAYRSMHSRLDSDPLARFKPDMDAIKKDVVMGFFEIIYDRTKARFFNLLDVMDELERAVEAEPKHKEMISPYLGGMIGDLGIVARALHELDIYQPWASGIEFIGKKKIGEIDKIAHIFVSSKGHLFQGVPDITLASVGIPFDGKFFYPSDEPRTRLTTERLQLSEQNLETFWETFRQQFLQKNKICFFQEFEYLFLKQPIAEQGEDPLETVKVNSRALKTFKKLFYAASQSDPVGDTPWKDFVYAMSAMGYEAEKLHGQSSLKISFDAGLESR